MAKNLYGPGSSHAASLINSGNYDTTASWSFSAEDGNKLLGPNGDDWTNYAKFHLCEDTSEANNTKARWKYPFGKDGKVYDSGLRAIRSRASAQEDAAISDRAGQLRDMIAKKEGKGDNDQENKIKIVNFNLAPAPVFDFRQADSNTAEMDFFGMIGQTWLGNGITKEDFAAALKKMPDKTKCVNMRMSSPGGDVFDGRAIANMMRQSPMEFNVNVIAECSSAASIVALAGGNTVHMSEGSMMLIHRCYTLAVGNSIEMATLAKELDKIDQEAVNNYCKKTGMSQEAVVNLMNENRYMTADECMQKGFCDSCDNEGMVGNYNQRNSSIPVLAFSDELRKKLKLPPFPKANSFPNRAKALAMIRASA